MIELFREDKRVGYERLPQAVIKALELGAMEAGVVSYLLKQAELERFAMSVALPEVDGAQMLLNLSRHFYRPLSDVTDYDRMLLNSSVALQ